MEEITLSKTLENIATAIRRQKGTESLIAAKDFSNEVFLIADDYLATNMLDGEGKGLSVIKNVIIAENIKKINEGAFKGLANLESVVFDKGSSVNSIGKEAFSGCSSLNSITFAEGLTSIGNSAFYNCQKMTINELPSTLTSIGYLAFYLCAITKVNISAKLTSITGNAFCRCKSLTEITVDEDNPTYYGNGNNAIIRKSDKMLISGCVNTEIPEDVVSVGTRAFENILIKSIAIPKSVTNIGDNAFYVCGALETITFDDSSELTTIGTAAFSTCQALTLITLPNSVTSIGNIAFQYCKALTKIVFSENITSIGWNAFDGCSSMEEYDFSRCNPNNPPTLNSVLVGSSEGWEIIIPNGSFSTWSDPSKTNWVNYKTYMRYSDGTNPNETN